MADDSVVSKLCEDVIVLLTDSGIPQDPIDRLRKMNADADHRGLLEFAEAYSNAMAFMDHAAMTVKLLAAWSAMVTMLQTELNKVNRKLIALENDKKANPETVESFRTRKASIEQEIYKINSTTFRLRLMNRISINYDAPLPQTPTPTQTIDAAAAPSGPAETGPDGVSAL